MYYILYALCIVYYSIIIVLVTSNMHVIEVNIYFFVMTVNMLICKHLYQTIMDKKITGFIYYIGHHDLFD